MNMDDILYTWEVAGMCHEIACLSHESLDLSILRSSLVDSDIIQALPGEVLDQIEVPKARLTICMGHVMLSTKIIEV